MSLYNKFINCFENWSEETFLSLHHPDFMLIRENSMTTLNDHAADVFSAKNPTDKCLIAKTYLVHENPYVMECRLHQDHLVTNSLCLKLNGLAWRAIENTLPIQKSV